MIPFIDIHTHRPAPETLRVVALRSQRLGTDPAPALRPYSCGIHPWDADRTDTDRLLEEAATAPCAAIGEIGLDYARGSRDDDRQQRLFTAQLAIADRRCLPVVLHSVRAFEEIMTQLALYPDVTAVFHGFVGSPQQAERAVAAGHYLSFGHASFRSPKSVEAMRQMPLERLFLETDDGEVAIDSVYDEAARLLGLPTEALLETLYFNFKALIPNL